MNSITIEIKNKTNLTLKLEKEYNVTYYKKPTLFSKLLLKEKEYPDIYFHKGFITSEAIQFIENAKITIVSSLNIKCEIIDKIPTIDESKIHIQYPYIIKKIKYEQSVKEEFKKKNNIDKNSKIIFFRGNDLNKAGIDVVLDVLDRMYAENFTLIIESSKKQIMPIELKIKRLKVNYSYILFEDYKNIDELFTASDIFLLPTSQKYFNLDVLKAMHYENVVFLMQTNHASEIIDTFSLIQSIEDRSVSFKIDSLLSNKDELKKIQEENVNIADTITFENNFLKITKIMDEYFDIS